jgi:hypothetical protein
MIKINDPARRRRPGVQANDGPFINGTVHCYFDDINMGTIRGHGGKKYSFTKADWFTPGIEPKAGLNVVFELDAIRAFNIRVR